MRTLVSPQVVYHSGQWPVVEKIPKKSLVSCENRWHFNVETRSSLQKNNNDEIKAGFRFSSLFYHENIGAHFFKCSVRYAHVFFLNLHRLHWWPCTRRSSWKMQQSRWKTCRRASTFCLIATSTGDITNHLSKRMFRTEAIMRLLPQI